VSRVTARLFVGVGKGQILVSKEARGQLLSTWLEPFYEDFGWMRRACKGLDRHLIEDGLANTILTLPLATQQEILLAWFNRFLNSGEDCPNIQRGFEVWWRRAFWKRNSEPEQPPRLRITAICENSWWHWFKFDMKGGGCCDIKVDFVWSNCFTGFFAMFNFRQLANYTCYVWSFASTMYYQIQCTTMMYLFWIEVR